MKRLLTVLASALLAAACGQVSGPSGPNGMPTSAEFDAALMQIQSAPYVVAHRGVRRVEAHWLVGGHIQDLAYREEVTTDGTGRYSVRPLEALSQVAPGFLLLQEARQGYIHRYRDFLVRDFEAFLENYEVLSIVEGDPVAERPTFLFELSRARDAHVGYRVWMDTMTALVLAYEEYDAQGALISAMRYEELTLMPDLGGVVFHQPNSMSVEETDEDALAQWLGFAPRLPASAPADHGASELERLVGPDGRRWAKVSYTDGVETVFYLESRLGAGMRSTPQDTGGRSSGGPSPLRRGRIQRALGPDEARGVQDKLFKPAPSGRGASSGAQPFKAGSGLGQGTPPAGRVVVYAVGPLTVVHGTLGDREVIALGKLPEQQLLELLESRQD
jgi:hypothetical protein